MITIDARWIWSSGIGTYLQNLLPGVINAFPDTNFTLLGKYDDLKSIPNLLNDRTTIVHAEASMYSIKEQLDYCRLIPRNTELYFSTHYNVPLFYSGRMLVTVHDMMHLAMPQFVHGYHKHLYAKLMFAAVQKKATSIITVSNFTKNEMFRILGKFEQPITPVHLGVGDELFSIPHHPSPHPHPYLLYVGNIKPHKNLKSLIRAFIMIADIVPHDLVLVGKKEGFITGDQDVFMLAQLLPNRIHFTGRVSDQQLHQYFSHAEALVFPSFYEGFGLPPLEAMAAGCPVVASNAGSLPEVCGDAAFYFNPISENDLSVKLLRVINDHELKSRLRIRGKERARSFTWAHCITQTNDVITQILDISKRNLL